MRDFTGQRISANLWRGREAVGGTLTDGTEHRFVLNTRSTVIEFLTTRIHA